MRACTNQSVLMVVCTCMFLLAHARPAPCQSLPTLTLVEAMEKTAAQNEDVCILEQWVKQSKAVRLQVLSGLLPWVTASASYGFTEEVVLQMGEGESRVIQPGTDWGWGVQGSLTLVDASAIPSVVAAGKNVHASQALLEFGREEILLATAQAFQTVLFAQASVEVRQRVLETRTQHRDRIRALVEADEALALDLGRAELNLLEAQSALEAARVDAKIAMETLNLLMGEDPGTEWNLAPLVGVLPGEPGTQYGHDLVAEPGEEIDRKDLEALELAISASEATKLSGWFSLVPALSISAKYDQGPESFRSPEGYTWSVVFSLSWTLFDGGYTVGDIMQSSSETTEALLELEKAEKSVQAEVDAAWLRFELAISNRDTAVKKLEVARGLWEMAEERYAAGLATGLEVEDALDDLAEAEMGLLGEEMNLRIAWLEYLHVSGQFSEFFEVD